MDFSQDRSSARRSPRVSALAAAILAALVAVSVLACGAGSTVAAAGHHKRDHHHRRHVPTNFFGVQPGPTRIDPADAAKIGATGIGTVRIGFSWLWVQPRPGPYNWTRVDQQVGILAAHGVEALPTLTGTPSWVADKPTTAPIGSPQKKRPWKAFVAAAVRRYGPGGAFWRPGLLRNSPFHRVCHCDAPPVPIKSWQVWNEPNLEHYYTPKPSPDAYASLLRITHSAIRTTGIPARVVMAGLSIGGTPEDIDPIPFLNRLYAVDGVKDTFDAVSIHPYARKLSGMRSVLTAVRKVVKNHGDRKTPMYITEVGWGSAAPNEFGTTKGIRGQRRIVERSMKMLLRKRKQWRLKRVYWFFWRDPPKDTGRLPCRICYSAGLLRSDREPKPAYRAFKRIVSPGS
jgi:polysaccharide biosynthesis protein PslG